MHGRGNFNKGPRLPSSLLNEAGISGGGQQRPGGPKQRRRGAVTKSRKEKRRQQREGKKASRFQSQQQRAAQKRGLDHDVHDAKRARVQTQQQPGKQAQPRKPGPLLQAMASIKDAKKNSVKGAAQLPGKSGAAGEAAPSIKPRFNPAKTRFEELLEPSHTTLAAGGGGVNSAAAFLADLRMQREAEKKLGIKKGGSLKGPSDGLTHFLDGLSVAGGAVLPSYLSKGAAKQVVAATGVAAARKAGDQRASASGADARPVDTDSDDEFGLGVLSRGDVEDDDGDEGETEDEYEEGEDEDEEGDLDGLSDGEAGGDSLDGEDVGEGDDSGDLDMGDDDSEADEGEEEEGGLTGSEEEGEGQDGFSDDFGEGEDSDVQLASGSGGSDEDEEEGGGGASDDDGDEKPEAAARASRLQGAGSEAKAASGRYVPPALRAAAAAGGGDAASAALERRLTGLTNRLAESNLQGIVKDIAELYASEGRRAVSCTVSRLLLDAAAHGPRATEAFAAVAAALIAGLAGTCKAPEIGANFLDSLARRLEDAVEAQDSLAQANLGHLVAHSYVVGLLGHDMMYSLLHRLRQRFTEADVTLMVTLLSACGLQLRNADPAAMKAWVMAIHERAAEVRASAPPAAAPPEAKAGAKGAATGGRPQAQAPAPAGQPQPPAGSSSSSSGAGGLSKRAQLMLELVIDIKNNKASKGGKGSAPTTVLSPGITKWLRSCGVDEVCVKGITWDKLLMPNKKGMWWMPAAGEALIGTLRNNPAAGGAAGAGNGSLASIAGGDEEAARLLSLAAAQRMSTDVRRAVFMAVMGSEDAGEAFERLTRLPLKGEQEREVVRVTLDCALHEEGYNPYYSFLLAKLAANSKAHRLTLQFALWDTFKSLEDSEPRVLGHLARIAAFIFARFALPLNIIKVYDFAGPMSAKAVFFWRTLLTHLLAGCKSLDQVEQVFLRVAMQAKQLGGLVPALLLFIRTKLGPWLAEQGDSYAVGKATVGELLRRAHSAESVLASARGASSSRLVGASHDDAKAALMMDDDLMMGPGGNDAEYGIIRAGEGASEDESELDSDDE